MFYKTRECFNFLLSHSASPNVNLNITKFTIRLCYEVKLVMQPFLFNQILTIKKENRLINKLINLFSFRFNLPLI